MAHEGKPRRLPVRFAGHLPARNQFLTTFTMSYRGITSDVTFTQAADDAPYRAVQKRQNVIEIPVWAVVLAALAVVAVIALAIVVVVRRRRKTA